MLSRLSYTHLIRSAVFAVTLVLGLITTPPEKVYGASLYESCNSLLTTCDSSLTCDYLGLDNKLIIGPTKYCMPHKDYPKCDPNSCVSRTDGRTVCSTVLQVSTIGKSTKNFAAVCLRSTDVPLDDTDVNNSCTVDADCVVGTGNRQCVLVTVRDTKGVDSFVSARKCIDVEYLPAQVLNPTNGSCGTNSACSSDQSCVQNVFEPSALQSYVCYAKKYIEDTGCSGKNAADACSTQTIKSGVCMNVIEGVKKLKCVNTVSIPNGPNAPSTQKCKTDADCKSQANSPYCLKNPLTLESQCFSQANIYTNMMNVVDECGGLPCVCSLAGTKGCEPTGKESICAEHLNGTAGRAVCIKYDNNGEALASGQGTPSTNPDHLATAVAEETYNRFAPELQIDIPGLSFTPQLSGQKNPDGNSVFIVPYIAQYIDAAYKYAIGFGVMIAVIMMMFMGFRWMTAFGNAKAISDAKSGLGNAVLGLILLLCAYTILYVINPDLPQMKALEIMAPKQDAFTIIEPDEGDQDVPEVDTNGQPIPGTAKKIRICTDYESCKQFCNGTSANMSAALQAAQEKGITVPSGLVDPRVKLAEYFKDDNCINAGAKPDNKYLKCGVVFRGRNDETLFLPAVIEGVANAAKLARSKGYVISIGSSYRSLKVQVEKVCAHVVNEPGKRPCGATLACPGGSPHMQGYATDLCLVHPSNINKCLTAPTGSARSCAVNTEKVKNDQHYRALNDIMFGAGWFKYCKELWHFEYTSKPADQFRTKTY